jgi:hypothetical protein
LPKQNRPLVRDGRLQAKKKRTDRNYLRPNGTQTAVIDETSEETSSDVPASVTSSDDAPPASSSTNGSTRISDAEPTVSEMAAEQTVSAPAAAAPAPAQAPAPAAQRSAGGRLPTTVRAIQQQGVRKRREFDVHALAIRDTQYAFHEMRRIFIFASAVVITLIVLGIVLR